MTKYYKELVQITDEQLDKEKMSLQKLDPLTIIGYIRSTVEILMNFSPEISKSQTPLLCDSQSIQSEFSARDQENGYEPMIVKLEEEIRNHIRVEQTFKLQIETLQFRLEEIENENQAIKEKFEKVKEVLIIEGITQNE